MIHRLCQASGCNDYAVPGHTYCEKHLAESQARREAWLEEHKHKEHKPFWNAERSNPFYNTYKWRQLKQKIIKRDQVCQQCGITAEESGYPLEVHHIIPPRGDEELFFDGSNCVALCKLCHARITAAEIKNR